VIALERMARMESMIAFLSLVSLLAIFAVSTGSGRHSWPGMLTAALFAAVCVAVHPEAVTALLLLGSLMLFVVPGRWPEKVAAVGLFLAVPLGVLLLIYGSRLGAAWQQFLQIAHDSSVANPTSRQWFAQALHNRDLSAMNRNLFLALIMLLLAAGPVIYLLVTRRLPHDELRYRLGATLAVVSVAEILLMVFVFQMSDRRCQFLFAPLLVCNVLCLWGAAPLRVWQSRAGWSIVLVQCAVGVFYLSARHDRVADMDPNRYLQLVQHLPKDASLAATPGLWLDLQEAKRPFTLILYGLDGEIHWGKQRRNPLDKFDMVLIEDYYAVGRPWWQLEAQEGRTRHTCKVGSTTVEVYVRPGISWNGACQ
jgi:hypothetical protein